MKIGIAQLDCDLGDVDANVRKIASVARRAADAGCGLVVFPEMADTGYNIDVIKRLASACDSGPCRVLRGLAANLEINIVCGFSERDGDDVYNSAAVIDTQGKPLGKYRKTHLFSMIGEDRNLSRGDSLTLVDVGGFKTGVMICYDLRFPEQARALALQGAELIVVIAAWPERRVEHWKLLTAARAVENQVYVAAVNRVGVDGGITFGGCSRVLDPFGAAVAEADGESDTLLFAELRRERLDEVRSAMHVFKDRRPDVYGSLMPGA